MFDFRRSLLGIKALLLGPAEKRQRVLNEIARLTASILASNYVGESHKIWLTDNTFIKKCRELSPHNYFSEERKFTLKELARSLKNIDGAIAECGSYVGASAWFVANELRDVDFYLFDSFEGLSEPSDQDKSPSGIQQWEKGDLHTSEYLLRKSLAEFSRIHILKGWIPDRFDEVSNLKFRLVHIDVDLYKPTLDSLLFFYNRLTVGGMIVIDDYGFQNCPGAYKATNDFMNDKPEHITHLPTGQGLIIRQYDS